MKSVSEKIKAYRKSRDMSQNDLARVSGIHLSTIKKYECGTRNPKPDQLLKIADALNVSINEFLSYQVKSEADILSIIDKLSAETNVAIHIVDNNNNTTTVTLEFEVPGTCNNLKEYYKRLKF